ncbi:MAG: protein arginine kinase [Planctomycetes bacterium]|nr:protein arginine kinase [Planctomycetota bacterium]
MSTIGDLVKRPCAWLESPGAHGGIVVSSRIRLARNLAQYPFQRKLSRPRQQDLVEHLFSSVSSATGWTDAVRLRMSDLSEVERQALTERQMVSRDLASGKRPAGVYASRDERVALMLNEEDHLRLQVIDAGFTIRDNLDRAVALDRELEKLLDWATHPRYGYLTACPTNAGTGMRASVMLHLSALAETQELRQVLRGLGKLHMTVRGLHGEGSEASGHYYQVSNQRCLGLTEPDTVDQLAETVEKIVAYEQIARQALIEHSRWKLEDRVFRAWGILTYARSIANDELVDQLSWARLGVAMGLLDARHWRTLDRIFLQCQPAHLQLQHAEASTPEVRDRLRATLVREWLTTPDPG